MNPAATARFRRVTGLLAVGWALLSIGLSVLALVEPGRGLTFPVHYSVIGNRALVQWTTEEGRAAGIEWRDRLVAIDGIPTLQALRMGKGDELSDGRQNRYTIVKADGRAFDVMLAPAPQAFDRRPGSALLHVALLLASGFFLAVGGAVWWNRPERADAWALMLFCSMMAVEVATSIRVDLVPSSAARLIANLPLLGATTFHLYTTYPIEPEWIVRYRRIRLLPYVGAFGFLAWILVEEALGRPSDWIAQLAFIDGIGLCLLSMLIPITQRSRAHRAGIGERVDMMILVSVVSIAPVLVLFGIEWLIGMPLPWHLALLWVAIFPLAVGFGMLRKQLFDFRIVARSSAAYGAATLAITGLFAFMITFADAVVSLFGVTVRSVEVAFLFLAILAFDPLRDRMQRFVDGVFDRDHGRYRQAVREISEAMVSMLSLREISDRILIALTDTMGVGRAMVLLFDESERVLAPSARRGDWEDDDADEIEIPAEHPIWKHLWMRREELARSDFDDLDDPDSRESCWDVFDALEIELLVPILYGVDLLGVIAVGRKLSGERLTPEDRQLLRTLANQSAIAIENGKAFDEIAQLNETLEARVDERTRELRETQQQLLQSEKLKSLGQLVAGVAHELNNPIGFVHANLQLLDEYIRKLVEAHEREDDEESRERIRGAIGKLLARSREGTERVKQIVMDLRTFSRMDQADLQNADLHEEIDRTVGLMEPRLKNRIEIVRDFGELPQVRCYPGQLNQVFLNLLMNACDALESGGTITIRTRPRDEGVLLEFSDDGPGIPEEVQIRIFDPFFTTKPVGVGTGLGLSLSHGIIERHGGRFSVRSEPGEGATFAIELPLEAPPPEALDADPAAA